MDSRIRGNDGGLDSRIRENDEGWIPAYARMTGLDSRICGDDGGLGSRPSPSMRWGDVPSLG